MTGSERLSRAFGLSLIAGVLILANAVSVGAAATWFPWVIPTLPGSSTNDTTVLYSVAAVGLISGVLVLLGAGNLHRKPANRKAGGIMILVFSILGYVTGGGVIIGSILGIISGAQTFRRRSACAQDNS